MSNAVLSLAERVSDFDEWGIQGWTTTRENETFGLNGTEAVHVAMERWGTLQDDLRTCGIVRLASATQVHGNDVTTHAASWRGWLRQRGVDGHVTSTRGTALVVTVADCTPVFIGHPSGAVAVLHAGWRGTAAHILRAGLDALRQLGAPADECRIHLGPSICGDCYEVGPEVLEAVTGMPASAKGLLDVRAVLADQAAALGVRDTRVSSWCTRHHGQRFFSHRGGDSGRQLGIIAIPE